MPGSIWLRKHNTNDLMQILALHNRQVYKLMRKLNIATLDRMMQAWDQLEVGGVVINDVPTFRVDNMPYGGLKDSGLGREGIRYAIEDMTELRLLVIAQPQR